MAVAVAVAPAWYSGRFALMPPESPAATNTVNWSFPSSHFRIPFWWDVFARTSKRVPSAMAAPSLNTYVSLPWESVINPLTANVVRLTNPVGVCSQREIATMMFGSGTAGGDGGGANGSAGAVVWAPGG